jgi:hypothetical protein
MKLYTRNGIMFVGLLAVAAIGITWLARAAFTTPLNAFAVWPRKTISDPNVGNLTIRGKAEEQVFRTGGPLGSGTFANLDPKNGVCPPGQVLTFLKGNSGAIGANDFVYALKVHNTAVAPAVLLADGPVNITQLSSSYCLAGAGLIPTSSIGYCSTAGQIPGTPTSFNESPGGLDFFWGNTGPGQDHSILPGQQSVVLFYTSPIPPARASATISGFGVTQQAVQGSGPPPSDDPDPPGNMNNFPIYGPCRTEIQIDKQIACTANGFTIPSFGPGPGKSAQALENGDVYYQIIVYNSGGVRLDNVMISDPKLKSGGNLTPDFLGVEIRTGNPAAGPTTGTGTPFAGTLLSNQSVTKVFGPFKATKGAPVPGTSVAAGVNTATATADYVIPNVDGTPSSQSVQLTKTDQATLTVLAPAIVCQKLVNGVSSFTIPDNAVYPFVLTYTLKGTNTGETNLNITLNDPKLQGLIAAPPAGVSFGGDTIPKVCNNVAPGGMCQATVTLTLANAGAFAGIANAGTPGTSTNTMTASGIVVGLGSTICATGANGTVTSSPCQATVTQVPPCSIDLKKEVACGTAQAPGVFGPTVTALKNASVVYRYMVTNTGQDTLNNVVISDNKLTDPQFNVGTLTAGQTRTILVQTTAATVGQTINIATAQGNCASASRTVTSPQRTATLNVVDPTISCDKTVNGVQSLLDYVPGTQLTYKLTATNTSVAPGATNLDLMIDDPIIRNLPGVACKRDDTNAAIVLPFTFTNVPPGASRSITCTVTFPDEASFKAASGGSNTLTNTMTVTASLTDQTICTAGVQFQLTRNCQASVRLTPPPPPDTFCIVIPCEGAGCVPRDPGQLPPAESPVSDQKAGSVLIYNLYASSTINPGVENTRMNITNTGQGTVFVHLFFVDGSTCSVADSYICLSPNQTLAMLASDIDPGIRGYMVAIATDDRGCPIKWNYLIGDEYVKYTSGSVNFAANLAAEAFAAIVDDPAGCVAASVSVPIRLDGVFYNSAPRVLAVDSIASNLDGNTTQLIINRLGGNLSSTASRIGPMFGLLYDALENPYSFQFPADECQAVRTLSNTFPRTTPRFDTIIPSGTFGWMRLWSADGNGLLGAVIVRNPNSGTNPAAYSQGHNMHKLTLGGAAVYQMPVFPPNP